MDYCQRLSQLMLTAAIAVPAIGWPIDGAFDTSWQGAGYLAFSGDVSNPSRSASVTQLTFDANGKMLVGGASGDGTTAYPWLGELTSAGAFIPTFGKSDGSGRVTLCQLNSSYCSGALKTLDALLVANNADLFIQAGGAASVMTPTASAIHTAASVQQVIINDVGGAIVSSNAARLRSDGSVIVAGMGYYSTASDANNEFAVARFTNTLSLDTTFNASTDTSGVTFAGGNLATFSAIGGSLAHAVLLRPDNRIVVLGEVDEQLAMACFTAAGLVDTACGGSSGKSAPTWAQGTLKWPTTAGLFAQTATTFDRAGRILIALIGAPSDAVGIADFGIVVARFNADLSNDTTFGDNGFSFTNHFPACSSGVGASSIALDSAGRIVVAGYCRSDNVFEFGVERLRGDTGALDSISFSRIILRTCRRGVFRRIAINFKRDAIGAGRT
jgi:uncharacterized delta-60 repeat protein